MLHSRHRTASGRLDEGWTYSPDTRRIHVDARTGSKPCSFTVTVCSAFRPVKGAHPIVQVDAESWRVLPARYVEQFRPRQPPTLEPFACPLSEDMAPGEALFLTNCPPEVSALLETL